MFGPRITFARWGARGSGRHSASFISGGLPSSNTHILMPRRFSLSNRPNRLASALPQGLPAPFRHAMLSEQQERRLMTQATNISPERSALVFRYHERLYRLAL